MGYYAAITAMDAGIGKILDYLDMHGLSEENVVIFTSDNGMNMGYHGIWEKEMEHILPICMVHP